MGSLGAVAFRLSGWRRLAALSGHIGFLPSLSGPFVCQASFPCEWKCCRERRRADLVMTIIGWCRPRREGRCRISNANSRPGQRPEDCVCFVWRKRLIRNDVYFMETKVLPFCSHFYSILYVQSLANVSARLIRHCLHLAQSLPPDWVSTVRRDCHLSTQCLPICHAHSLPFVSLW